MISRSTCTLRYRTEVSKDTISRITDAIVDDMVPWQPRPLDPVYAVLAIRVRESHVANRPAYVAVRAPQPWRPPTGDLTHPRTVLLRSDGFISERLTLDRFVASPTRCARPLGLQDCLQKPLQPQHRSACGLAHRGPCGSIGQGSPNHRYFLAPRATKERARQNPATARTERVEPDEVVV